MEGAVCTSGLLMEGTVCTSDLLMEGAVLTVSVHCVYLSILYHYFFKDY